MRKRRCADSRGQTTLDFAIGISLFLGVVIFVFVFVPGILEPFTVGAQDETVTTNRVADDLTQGMLGSPENPNVLQTHCVLLFFEGSRSESSLNVCGFEGDSLNEYVGINDRQNVNVSVHGNVTKNDHETEPLCWDDDPGEGVREKDEAGGSCEMDLAAGGSPPDNNADSVTATRVAAFEAEDVTIEVEMW